MKIYSDFMAVFPGRTTAWGLLLASLMVGYTSGLQIAHYISGIHLQSAPSEGDDSSSAVFIPVTYLEVSEPPTAVQKIVTVDCVGPDGKHMQLTPQACSTFTEAWKNK